MGVNSLPKTVTRRRRGYDLNPGPSAPESSTLSTRLPRAVVGIRRYRPTSYTYLPWFLSALYSSVIVNKQGIRGYTPWSENENTISCLIFLCLKIVSSMRFLNWTGGRTWSGQFRKTETRSRSAVEHTYMGHSTESGRLHMSILTRMTLMPE